MRKIPDAPFQGGGSSALGQLAAATITGAVLPLLVALFRPSARQQLTAASLPWFVLAFGFVGFGAGAALLLFATSVQRIAERKTGGRGAGWWPLLKVAAILMLLVVVLAVCMILSLALY